MKKMTLHILFIFLLVFHYAYSDENCRKDLECDPENKYGIRICNYETETVEIICIKSLDDIPSHMRPRMLLNMPICIDFDYSSLPNKHTYYSGLIVLDAEGVREDIENAVREWNCLCDFEGCKQKVKASFSDNKDDFTWDDWRIDRTLAKATTNIKGGCEIDVNVSNIKFNNTSFFRYNNNLETQAGGPIYSFINRYYEYLLDDMPDWDDFRHYSFYDVVLHEFGHILGFLDNHKHDCANGKESIMNGIPHNVKTRGLYDYDKCMFMTFYCPGLIGIYDYAPTNTNLFPNPSHDFVGIEFELDAYSENVTIKIMDGLGRILLTPIENKTYDSGVHTEQINVKGFENGYYYMLIQTPNKSFVQPFIVIK